MNENASTTVTLTATDADGDLIDFSPVTVPAFATLSGATLTLAPGYSDSGQYTLTLRASDGQANTDATLLVTVANVNRSPSLSAITDVTIAPNATQTVNLSATDPDGDAVSFSLGSSTPSWITVSGSTLSIAAPSSSAPVSVQVIASDNQTPALTDIASFVVTVQQALAGTIQINSGAQYATSSTVTLTLSATSSSGSVQQMRFSNDGATWTAFEAYATTRSSYPLSAGDGTKTVYVEFKDASNAVAQFSDTIILDTVRPVATLDVQNGKTRTNQTTVPVTITPSETPVQQAITVVASSLPTPTTPGTFGAYSSPASVYLGTAQGGKKICVWLKDAAGNVSASPTVYSISYDNVAPTVSTTAPTAGATGVPRDVKPLIGFSEPMDPATITSANISINNGVTASVRYVPASNGWYAVVTPSTLLSANTTYTVTVSGLTDEAGNAGGGTTFSFTTGTGRAISGYSAPLQKLQSARNAAGTMVVSELSDGYSNNELLAYFHNGTGWTATTLSAGSSSQLAAFGDSFAVAWNNPSYYAPSMAVFSNGQWKMDAPAPSGRIFGSGSRLMSVSPFTQSYPYSFSATFFDGTSWVATGGGATDVVVSTPGVAGNDNGAYAIVYGKWVGGSSYNVLVNRFDGTNWTTSTLGGGSFPGAMQAVGSGSSFLACWSAGSSACAVLNPTTGAWTVKSGTPYSPQLVGNGSGGFALGAIVTTTTSNVNVEVHNGQSWQTGGAVLSAPGNGELKIVDRPNGYVAVWGQDLDLRASTFDGTSWSTVTTLATATATEPLSISSVRTVGSSTIVTWHDSVNVYARSFDGTTWTTTTQLNGADRSGVALVAPVGTSPTVFVPESSPVIAHPYQPATGTFGTSVTVGSGTLTGQADRPAQAFDGAGKGLAAWEQFDGGRHSVYGAYFDGSAWGTPFRIGTTGYLPKVAYESGKFVIAYLAYTGIPTTNKVKAATWTLAGGLTSAVDVGSLSGNGELGLAARTGGFMATWLQPGSTVTLVSSVSADGVSWSTPVTVDSGSRSKVVLAGGGIGFVVNSQTWTGTQYANSARVWNGSAWSSALTSLTGECKVAAGTGNAAILCSSTSFSASVFTTSWGTATSFGQWTGASAALASNGAGFRAMFANQTRTWSAGTWSTNASYTPGGASDMASNGSEYFAVGLVQDARYITNLQAYQSTSGVMAGIGAAESSDGEVWSGGVAYTGTGYSVLWSQNELPSGITGMGNRLVYGRTY